MSRLKILSTGAALLAMLAAGTPVAAQTTYTYSEQTYQPSYQTYDPYTQQTYSSPSYDQYGYPQQETYQRTYGPSGPYGSDSQQQSYDSYGRPVYSQQETYRSDGGLIGSIISAVTGGSYGQSSTDGYGQVNNDTSGYDQYSTSNPGYRYSRAQLIQQCSTATQKRLVATYRSQGSYGYQPQGGPRVLTISSVQQGGSGLQVRGTATSGTVSSMGHYGQQSYGSGQADLTFSCRITALGQVSNIDVYRNGSIHPRHYRYGHVM